MNFRANSLASIKPSATSMISQMSSKSGTTMAQGLQESHEKTQLYSHTTYKTSVWFIQKMHTKITLPITACILFLLYHSNLPKLTFFFIWYISDLPKESFQILRQLRPAGVAWIHRDKDPHRRHQVHFLTHKVKAFLLVPNGILDTFHLIIQKTPVAKDQI